jgi:hypothetical protein
MAPQGSGWKVLFYPSTSRTSHFEWLEYVGITTDSPIFSKQIPKLHDFSIFSTVSIAANSCLELLSHASLLLAPPGRASPADPKGPAKSRSKNLPMGYHRGILKGLSWDYHGDML